jgi:hypothetical protein
MLPSRFSLLSKAEVEVELPEPPEEQPMPRLLPVATSNIKTVNMIRMFGVYI